MHDVVKNLKLAKYPIGDVTQWFGESPSLYAHLDMKGHNGIDIVRPHGEPMFAVEEGTIVDVKDTNDGYGKHLRLISKLGTREWTYGHCHGIFVKQGQYVKAGQFLATMGNTGFVVSGNTPYWGHNPYAGTHLHLGLRLTNFNERTGWSYPGSNIKFLVKNYENGYKGSVDPRPYLRDQKLKSTTIERMADAYKSKVLMDMSILMRGLNL
jgi:murein DD-endopeptidase MepM/ murein hydrolase activator NlpD